MQTSVLVRAIMNDRQVRDYEAHKECNFAISPQGIGRFRVNAFIQQGLSGAVLRTITSSIPEMDDLNLPPVLKDLIMTKRGLILVVGGTGSGKSTTPGGHARAPQRRTASDISSPSRTRWSMSIPTATV